MAQATEKTAYPHGLKSQRLAAVSFTVNESGFFNYATIALQMTSA